MNTNEIDLKVKEIVQALGDGWDAAKPRLILHEDGYGFEVLTDSRIKMKDRLIFAGYYGYQGEDLAAYTSERSRQSLPNITVSINRDSEAIANEIKTRLLPRYLNERAKLLECRNAYKEQRWREYRIAINLRNSLGERETQHESSKVWRDFPRRSDRRAITVEAWVECWHPDAPAMVRVSIQGLAPEEAEELLTWLQKINPIADVEVS